MEARAADLRALVREGGAAGKGVVLVLEDLGYAAEAWKTILRDPRAHGYCPVEHAVMELSSLVRGGHDMFWLLGFGTYASYTSCRSGQPSLEAVLELHPVVVPDGSLASLSLAGDRYGRYTSARLADSLLPQRAVSHAWVKLIF